jgi:hypothetical protein
MGNLNFDASNIEPSQSFEPIPDGWYAASIIEAAMVPTRDGTTELLKLTFEIDGPNYAGRRVWERLNVNHANEQPRQIAQRNLSSICRAIGKLQVADTDELLGAKLLIKVRAVPADGKFDARNEIRGYKAGMDTPSAAPAPKMSAPAAAPAKAAPWRR